MFIHLCKPSFPLIIIIIIIINSADKELNWN